MDHTVPAVVGVTGHRDLLPDDVPRLEEVVAGLLAELSPPPMVLSALAEGADRLVARVALRCGAALVVPLPFPPDDYEADFADQASKREFRELLAAAAESFVVPGACAGERREAGYLRVGRELVARSRLLLALWDGEHLAAAGGTSDVVRMCRGRTPVLHLATRHLRKPQIPGAFTVNRLEP